MTPSMHADASTEAPEVPHTSGPSTPSGSSRSAAGWAAAILLLATISTIGVSPLFDPDEGYYPATAAESVDAGAPWDPQLNGEPRWDKPILSYALIEASFELFGRTVTASRIPSVLEGMLLALIVGFAVKRVAGARAASLAAGVLCTTTGIQIFARVAHPEIGVVLMITTAELLAVLWIVSDCASQRLRLAALGGLALGLGILFKGPVAVVLPLLAVGTGGALIYGIRRPSAQALRHSLLAAVICAGVAVPWYAAMVWRHGHVFLTEAVWRQNASRFLGEAFVHRSRPWFFVLPLLVAMFPWTAFVPAALAKVSRTCRRPADVMRLFMAAAAVTSFLFYSASGSKLPHYALVFVPPLAILVAFRLNDAWTPRDMSTTLRWTAGALALAAAGLAISPWLIGRWVGAREILAGLSAGEDVSWLFARAVWPPAVVLAGAAFTVMAFRLAAWRTILVAGAILPTIMILAAQPLLARAYPEDHFGARLRSSALPVWLIGARAPSLTFYAGRPVVRLSEGEAAQKPLPAADCLIVADTAWLKRRAAAPADASRLQPLESYGGMTLALWRGAPQLAERRTSP